MLKKVAFIFLSLFIAAEAANAQPPTTAPKTVTTQTATPASKKSNQRPATAPPAEPFDKADVKTMLTKCVRLETESGIIEMEMFPETAPETVRNFLNLTAIGAFDTTVFSRVVPGFVIQGGNLSTHQKITPRLAERSFKTIVDEPNPVKHTRGIVSMARPDTPNSASTHFFILLRDAPTLDASFAAFAHVTNGMEVVEAINKMPVEGEKPVNPVRIKKAGVYTCPAPVVQP